MASLNLQVLRHAQNFIITVMAVLKQSKQHSYDNYLSYSECTIRPASPILHHCTVSVHPPGAGTVTVFDTSADLTLSSPVVPTAVIEKYVVPEPMDIV